MHSVIRVCFWPMNPMQMSPLPAWLRLCLLSVSSQRLRSTLSEWETPLYLDYLFITLSPCQSLHTRAEPQRGYSRFGSDTLGHGALPADGLFDLLLLAMEGYQHVGQGCLVHGTLSLCCAPYSTDTRHHLAGLCHGYTVLSESQLRCHLQGRGLGWCGHAGLLLAGPWLWGTACLRLVQQVSQQCVQVSWI